MAIQVGANDGQTINIDLQKIDSSTLGLGGFSVSNNALKLSDSITQVGASGSLKDVDLSAVATSLGVDASTLTLHNVQDSTGAATATYVVSSGSDNYAVSVADATGAVSLNTANVTYTDANGGTGTLTGVAVKVGADATGAAQVTPKFRGKNYSLSAASIVNGGAGGTTGVAEAVTLNTAGEFTGVSTQIHWLCWTKLSLLLINSVLLWVRYRTV